jgi:hypothetical protein
MAESKSFALRGESLATAARTLLHLSVAALSDDDQVAAKAALVRVINEAFARAEPSFASRDGESDEANESIESNETIETSDECDALLLTLTLCAIAAKPLDGSNDEYKSHSRVLAMDLIRQLLEGPVAGAWLARWRVHLRKPLCVAVLRAWRGWLGPRRVGAGAGDAVSRGRGFEPRRGRRVWEPEPEGCQGVGAAQGARSRRLSGS